MRILQSFLSAGLVGAALLTLVAPFIIKLLFTAPVSFGTNCEPAAQWAMSKLIQSQMIGVGVGVVGFAVIQAMWRRRQSRQAPPQQPSVTRA